MDQLKKFVSKAEDSSLSFFNEMEKIQESKEIETLQRHVAFLTTAGMLAHGFSAAANATSKTFLTSTKEFSKKEMQKSFSEISQACQKGGSTGAVVGLGLGVLHVCVEKSVTARKNLKEKSEQLLKERNQKVSLGKQKKVPPLSISISSQRNTNSSRKIGR